MFSPVHIPYQTASPISIELITIIVISAMPGIGFSRVTVACRTTGETSPLVAVKLDEHVMKLVVILSPDLGDE